MCASCTVFMMTVDVHRGGGRGGVLSQEEGLCSVKAASLQQDEDG